MSLHVPTLLFLDSQSCIQETVLTTFYDYLRRLVSLHMVKTFMSIDITNLLNLLARITNWKSLFCITPFSQYLNTQQPRNSLHGKMAKLVSSTHLGFIKPKPSLFSFVTREAQRFNCHLLVFLFLYDSIVICKAPLNENNVQFNTEILFNNFGLVLSSNKLMKMATCVQLSHLY